MNKTSLYDEHVRLQATIVPFAGFLMPLQYTSIAHEHQQVRHDVGIFDVSHMGEIFVEGLESLEFVNFVLTNKIPRGPQSQAVYTLLCDEAGHIIDDLIVYPLEDRKYLFVVNASNTDKDFQWLLRQTASFEVTVNNLSASFGQIAIQGPRAHEVIAKMISPNAEQLKFMNFAFMDYQGKSILVSRSGYTGEDGYELYADPDTINGLWRKALDKYKVTPCGLGARDTLRFEAALSLYGHEIDDHTSPLEAGLKFAVAFDKEFIGREPLSKELENGIPRKIVGLEIIGRGIARADYEVFKNGTKIGKVTTGYLLPDHQVPLALAMISRPEAILGDEVEVQIRNQMVKAKIRDIKFMEKKYKR